MSRAVGLALVVTLLATVSTPTRQSPTTPSAAGAGTAAISGIVADAATGTPIAGASVSLLTSLPEGRQQLTPQPPMLTDARGRFVFTDLPSGVRYIVWASRSGYATGDTAPIPLADGEWMRTAKISLWRLGAISGRVVDERGEPVVGAAVRLFSRRFVAGRQHLLPGPVAATDDRGVYRLALLQPDAYVVGVLSVQATVPASTADGARRLPLGGLAGRGSSSPPVAQPETHGVGIDVDGRHRLVLTNFATPPPQGDDRPRAYPPLFYPNARSLDDARAIQIENGSTRANVDFQLQPQSTARVSGRVIGAVAGAANMVLRIMPRGGEHLGFGSEIATTLVETDGRFTFLNVPAGSYTLLASPSVTDTTFGGFSQGTLPDSAGFGPKRGASIGYPQGFYAMWWRAEAGGRVSGRQPLEVGSADIADLALALQTGAMVSGRIVFDDAAPPDPSQRFSLSLEPANGDLSLGLPNAWTAAGDPSRAFEMEGLQNGRYLFRFQAFGGWRIKSVTSGGADITDSGIDGAMAQRYDDVVVTVTKSGGELSGTVVDRMGLPAAGAVLLFPVESEAWTDYGLTPDRLSSTNAGSDGTFRMGPIRAGEYFVIAVPTDQRNAWTNPAFLAAAAPRAARITLKTAAVGTQRLQVTEVIVR